jgi:D-glycero-D-manno-heptose 1,7-bisphosphate phosphatase
MLQLLPQIDAVYTCNHEDGVCDCRKPKPGLLYQAEQDFQIDKNQSMLFGDSLSDIEAAEKFGIKGYLTTDLYSTIKEVL